MIPEIYQEHSIFIDQTKKLVAAELTPHIRDWEKKGEFPNKVFEILGQQGFLGILIPENLGGVGGDYKLAGAWCESFGELCDLGLVTAVNMHSLVITPSIARFGSKKCQDRWIPPALEGKAIGAYAFTEPGAGSDLSNLRTTATRKGSKWVIRGSKTFITNGARADFILVLTKTDPAAGYKGFTTFIVDTKTPGFKVTRKLDKLGWLSSDTAEMTFDDVEVDDDTVLGKVGEGWVMASNNLTWERLMLTLTTLAGARQCLRDTVTYTKNRSAFGKTLIDIEVVADILTQSWKKLIKGEALSHFALELLNAGKNCRAEVAAAKRMICDDALWIADRGIQLHGGYGYTKEFLPEKWWRDLRLMPIGGGTSEIMAEIVWKDLSSLQQSGQKGDWRR